MKIKAVAYYRVSTDRQGQSGLGLEAQQKSLHEFIRRNDYELIAEYTEVESSNSTSRPILQKALIKCRKNKATLLIARLDRLARNVAFISALLQTEVQFISVDNPHADKFMTHIRAAVAELEKELISTRTKQALQAAKNRGVELGVHGKYVLSKRNKDESLLFAEKMKPIIMQFNERGITSIRKICKELNRLKIPTYRGHASKWHPQTVHALLVKMRDASH